MIMPGKAFPWRSMLVGALFVITVLNYIDRQTLSILAPVLQRQMSISDRYYAHIVTAFLFAYTLSYLLAGPITDRLGSRHSMTIFSLWWSFAEMLPPLLHSAFGLGISRFLLGIGEAGNYVAAPKSISENFQPRHRALALGIYTAGATIGATLAPPLVSVLSHRWGWQSVFFATGLAGVLWTIPWILLQRRLPPLEQEPPQASVRPSGAWKALLQRQDTYLLLLARLLTDPVWYFYLFWYPKYLQSARHLTLGQTGHTAWVVYLAADLGTLASGFAILWLLRTGFALFTTRYIVLAVAAATMLLSPLVATSPTVRMSFVFASCIAFSHMLFLVTLTTVVLDRFPTAIIGTATGLIAAGSGLGGMLSTEAVGAVVAHFGYTPLFWAMAVLHPLALLLLWQLRRPTTPASTHSFQSSISIVSLDTPPPLMENTHA
jgi:ACS family hexuronate transporter-like MFS transporter